MIRPSNSSVPHLNTAIDMERLIDTGTIDHSMQLLFTSHD